MTQELANFNEAKSALAKCVRVDEVLQIRDLSERMKLYGKQAKDKELIVNAAEEEAS